MSATSATSAPATTPRKRTFALFYAGEFIAITGMEIALFAIWLYIIRQYGVPVWLQIATVLWYLPFIIASPFAGSLVDRWGARRSMVVACIAGSLNFMAIALFTTVGASLVGPVLFVCAMYFAVVLKIFHLSAFDAAIPFLVPKRNLAKANGVRLVVTVCASILGFAVAEPLLDALSVYGVVAMGCLCYAFALLTLRNVSIKRPDRAAADTAAGSLLKSLLTEFGWAWRYVTARPGLASLLGFVALIHVGLSSCEVLWRRMASSFASGDEIVLVAVSALAGVIVGTVLMVTLGSVRRLADTILASSMLLAGAIVLGSLRPNTALLAIAAFLLLASGPVLIGSIQTLMQLKVAPGMLGRTAAMRNALSSLPYLAARLTSLLLLLPLVAEKDVHAPWLAAIVGAGPGRGIATSTLVIGLVLAACFLLLYLHSSMRSVEQNFPDVTPHDLASDATQSAGLEGTPTRSGSGVPEQGGQILV